MELVEHVPDPASLVCACANWVPPGGDVIFATVNRTWLARLLVIGLAEYVLGIVARGTHHYRRFVRPAEPRHGPAMRIAVDRLARPAVFALYRLRPLEAQKIA